MLMHFVIALLLIVVIDFVWLGLIMSSFYVGHLGELGRVIDGQFKPMLFPAAVVYTLLAIGICYFVLNFGPQDPKQIFIRGALLGLVIYGVYDMTNMSTLSRWPLQMALVDMAWGSVLCGTVAVLTNIISSKLS